MEIKKNKILRYIYKKFDIFRMYLLYTKRFMCLDRHSTAVPIDATKNSIEIIPHEGLGDLIALIPAFQSLCSKYDKVWIHIEYKKFEILKNTFKLPRNLSCINRQHTKNYNLNTNDCIPKKSEKLIVLGHYSSSPIYRYPISFYDQLEVKRSIAKNMIAINQLEIPQLGVSDYVYVNLTTSSGNYFKRNIQEYLNDLPDCSGKDIIQYVDHNTLLIFVKNEPNEIKISGNTFLTNLSIALHASTCLISDAAIYNALIRLNSHPKIYVQTRNPIHTHCSSVYEHEFDGKIHFVPQRNYQYGTS